MFNHARFTAVVCVCGALAGYIAAYPGHLVDTIAGPSRPTTISRPRRLARNLTSCSSWGTTSVGLTSARITAG